ncbi:MAG: transglycosylase SLT domain-containing protein [Thermoanaerobaculia bacterium]
MTSHRTVSRACALLCAALGAARCASHPAPAPASAAPAPARARAVSPAEAAISRATEEFERGRELALNGDIDCARESFEKALHTVGPGSAAPSDNLEVLAFSEDLYDSILRYEALAAPAEETAGDNPPPASPLAALETAQATESEVLAAESAVSSDAAGAPYDIPIVVNEPVLRVLAEFQNDLHAIIARGLVRSGRYVPMIHRVFAEEGVPLDLAHMALVESSFLPRAVSSARAHGLWQFMSRTGRQYGLTANSVVDERSDPEKATRAAARYLKFLHELFNDWHLAMAAYNAGEGKILKAMAKTGSKDFWQLAQTRAIKKQTQTYVPAVLAATLIAKNPLHYGFDIVYEPPLAYEKITLDRPVSLLALSRAARIPLDDLQGLNPELKRSITPRQPDGYELKVPVGARETMLAVLPDVPTARLAAGRRYTAHKGDTIPKVARRFGVRADELAALNRLPQDAAVKRGRTLEIPEPEHVARAKKPAASPQANAEPAVKSYRVQGGDTLYAIARRHGTTVGELSAANNLVASAMIKPGDRLTIPIKIR